MSGLAWISRRRSTAEPLGHARTALRSIWLFNVPQVRLLAEIFARLVIP